MTNRALLLVRILDDEDDEAFYLSVSSDHTHSGKLQFNLVCFH